MALRKGLGGCWAEGDSLSGMAVHYTMVTRSGLGSRGPLLLTSGHWWLVAGCAVVAGRWCGRVVSLPGCWALTAGTCSAAGVTLAPCPCHTTQLSPGWLTARYTACTISVTLSWLSLCLYPAAVQCLDAARRAVSR